MSLTKEIIIDNISLVGDWSIQVRETTVIKEDDEVISTSFSRKVLMPFRSAKDSDGKWVHEATDISKEDSRVQALCNSSWSNDVKNSFNTATESRGI